MAIRYSIVALVASAGLALSTTALMAQEVEMTATPEEATQVTAAIAMIGCELGDATVEKENDNLFEIDDAACAGGQFDIKLDGTFTILSITNDGPIDPNAAVVEATAEELQRVTDAIAALNCTVGESPVEKETATIYEIDDAQCEAGQFDIKLDGEFNVMDLTRD